MNGRRAFPKVVARVGDNTIRANGREGETLLLLARKGQEGVRAYDFAGGPPFRLGAYVHDLRRMGVPIRTEREPHHAGSHAVYVAETPIEVLSQIW